MLRVSEQLARCPALDDRAAVDERHLVRDLARELELVRHDHHGPALARELLDQRQHLPDELRIQRGRRLVEQQELRSEREGAHDPDPLLLPAGQLVRIAARLVRQPDAVEQDERLGCHRGPRAPLHDDGTFRHVLQDGLVRKQVVVLEDHRGAVAQGRELLLRGFPGEVQRQTARQVDRPAVGPLQAVQAAQDRRLARSRGTDEGEHLAAGDGEVDGVEHAIRPEALGQAAHGQQRIGLQRVGRQTIGGGGVSGRHSGPIVSRARSACWTARGRSPSTRARPPGRAA